MDYGTLRGAFALLILALFIIIVAWSYSKKRTSNFDEVANSIFDESDIKDNKEKINKQETNNNV
ncbi:MAG: CcoQ/FixQ family Cbb3-type cytochrome c oxidase assembly chaperone [Colwellia sp.]|nr:CcoQ/FixQ family Cbb3-type cytochrome c oxidase assembly chaperone [Colwellia sp.]